MILQTWKLDQTWMFCCSFFDATLAKFCRCTVCYLPFDYIPQNWVPGPLEIRTQHITGWECWDMSRCVICRCRTVQRLIGKVLQTFSTLLQMRLGGLTSHTMSFWHSAVPWQIITRYHITTLYNAHSTLLSIVRSSYHCYSWLCMAIHCYSWIICRGIAVACLFHNFMALSHSDVFHTGKDSAPLKQSCQVGLTLMVLRVVRLLDLPRNLFKVR